MVERMVENLLANAGRHTTPDTPVWVRVAHRGQGVLLAVEDAGAGVPRELQATLFEPFRQGPGMSAHAPGVGIGLSLVARFAELHGGRAWVQDRPGGGASFRVLLPDTDDPADVGGRA
ncbi:MAG TPA: ATP-binding protein [Actinomycetes bacterium]|nr:ATP-binding protein [Actinomycetes bacterium]